MTDKEAKRFEKRRQDDRRYQRYVELKKKIAEANEKWNAALRTIADSTYFYGYLTDRGNIDTVTHNYKADTDSIAYYLVEYKAEKITLTKLATYCCGLFNCNSVALFYKDEQGVQYVRDEATVIKLICDYILLRKEKLDTYKKGIEEEKRLLKELEEL